LPGTADSVVENTTFGSGFQSDVAAMQRGRSAVAVEYDEVCLLARVEVAD
jgi:hypothetical protein